MEFIKKNKNYIIWAGCLIMAIAVFLTFVKVSAFGTNEGLKFNKLTDEYGSAISAYFVLVAAIFSAVLVYLKKDKISLVTTALALFITFFDYFKVRNDVKSLGSLSSLVKVSYVAPWVVLIGAIIAIVPVVIDIINEKKGN